MTSPRPLVTHVKVDTRLFRVAVAFSGMSHAQLAKKAGVSKALIGNLNSGTRNTCKGDTAAKIARVLNLKAIKLTAADVFDMQVTRNPVKAAA